jgi:hypothetical protein
VLLTALFSAPVYGAYILAVNLLPEMPAGDVHFIAVFTWTPGAAALATRLIVRRSLRGLGWGWGTTHLYLAGVIALPAVVLHASCNAAQYVLAALTKETALTEYFTLQYGAGFAIASCLLLGFFWKRLQAMGLTLRGTSAAHGAP